MKHPRLALPTIHRAQVTCYVFAALILAIVSRDAVADVTVGMMQVEVFTTTDREVVTEYAINTTELYRNIDFQFYPLNGLQLVEAELSKYLTADPEQSKHQIFERIQIPGDQSRVRMQRSAIGLARAMQYGIDRFPAIVFDSQAVVYGVTDLHVALAHYEAWWEVAKP